MTLPSLAVLVVAAFATLSYLLLRGRAITGARIQEPLENHAGRGLIDEAAAAVDDVYGAILRGRPKGRR
jgi:hypothetical protein